ncbi:MAG: ArnT family glycosyltransferase [Chloroflexota bacterium]
MCAVSIGVRLPFLSVPLITDEGGYAYVAHWMGQGLALYRDLWFDRPQAIFLLYGAQMTLLGESTQAIRLGAAFYNAATAVAIYALGNALRSRVAGLTAAGLFAIGSASPAIEGFTANGELYMNLPVVVALLCAVHGRWFGAGVLCALACAVKPTALAGLAPPLVLLWWWQSGGRLGSARLGGVGAVAGALPFVVHGVASDAAVYWYSLVGFRVSAHSAFSVGGALFGDFFQTAPTALAALAPLWLLAAVGVARVGRSRAGAVAGVFLAGSLMGAAVGGNWYWHYYAGVVPAAALLAGLAVDRPAPRWLTAALVATILPALFFNARLMGETPEETSLRIYRRPAYAVAHEISAQLRESTRADQTIFIAFAQADLYHLAGRRSAGKHLYWTEINRVPGALDEVTATLSDAMRRPAYVVEIDRELEEPGRSAAFWQSVARHYDVEREIGGFKLHRARERE